MNDNLKSGLKHLIFEICDGDGKQAKELRTLFTLDDLYRTYKSIEINE